MVKIFCYKRVEIFHSGPFQVIAILIFLKPWRYSVMKTYIMKTFIYCIGLFSNPGLFPCVETWLSVVKTLTIDQISFFYPLLSSNLRDFSFNFPLKPIEVSYISSIISWKLCGRSAIIGLYLPKGHLILSYTYFGSLWSNLARISQVSFSQVR